MPFGRKSGNLTLQVNEKRYKGGTIILTSNLPFSQRGGSFADEQRPTAVALERLVRDDRIVESIDQSSRPKDKWSGGTNLSRSRASVR